MEVLPLRAPPLGVADSLAVRADGLGLLVSHLGVCADKQPLKDVLNLVLKIRKTMG